MTTDEMYLQESERKLWEERLTDSISEFTSIYTWMRGYPDDGDGKGGNYWVALLESILRVNHDLQSPPMKTKGSNHLRGYDFGNYLQIAQHNLDYSESSSLLEITESETPLRDGTVKE